ncbi:MFS transporter [Vibrio aquaticus]|uniref:MFS transporter n=1 Tax=Vibrio aquaticus TaxID=2496559 RepID=A0A432D251_9VIBR|nr:MFS transporter [Vibrio aquaticus]RTZ18023.1 MFS transporter [Vibrio aquaticus]
MNMKPLILISIILLQACLGGTYAWSLFDANIIALGWTNSTMSGMPFNIFYIVFPVVLLFARVIIQKLGTRASSLLGLFLFSGGWGLCYFSQNNIYMIILGVGLLGGIGVGICYLIPIMVGTSWFPNHTGLITGIAVAGFASGSAIVSKTADIMMTSFNWLPNTVLAVIGVSYLGIGLFPAMNMVLHKQKPSIRCRPPSSYGEVLKNRYFQTLFGAMTSGLAVGFFVNSKLITLSEHFVPTTASLIAIFAAFNAIGRLSWGALSDKLNILHCIRANLLIQALGVFVLFQMSQWQYSAVIIAGLTGFNYGGVLVLYANASREYWGLDNFSQVYSLLFLSNIVAALINALIGIIYHYYSINLTVIILTAILIIPLLLVSRSTTRHCNNFRRQ